MLTAAAMWRSRGVVVKRMSGAGVAMFDQGVVSLCNFISIYLLARTMRASDFGILMLAQTVILLGSGVHNALIVQPQSALGSSLSKSDYAGFLRALLPLHLLVAFALAVIIFTGGVFLPHTKGHPLLLLELSAVVVAWIAQEFVRRSMYVRSDTRGALVNDAICYGLQLAGVVALVIWGTRGFTDVAYALAIFGVSSLIAALVGIVQMRRRFAKVWKVSTEQTSGQWRIRVWHLGKWLVGKNVVGWFGGNGHEWIVAALLGTQTLGMYRAAVHLINVINPVRLAAISYLSPRGSRVFYRQGPLAMERWVRRARLFSVGALLPMVIVLIAFPDFLLHLAYGQKFAGMGLGLILALATVSQVIMFSNFSFEVALISMNETRWLFFINFIPVLLLGTVGLVLIKGFGLLGVPFSALTIAVSVWLATWMVYRRLTLRARSNLPEGVHQS